MLFSPRIDSKSLVGLCRRVGTSIETGIDVRTIWAREVQRTRGPLHDRLVEISAAINRGRSLAEAFEATGDYFPPLLREMVALGEQTGHLDAIFLQLADHYQNQIATRRVFLAAIAWPMVQLAITIVIIGFLIWVMGVIREMTHNQSIDILGLGLIGNQGLMIYTAFVVLMGVAVWITIRAINRGLIWTRPIQRFILRLPGIGKPLRTLALSRLAWSMQITMNVGMDVRRAMRLSLNNTQNAFYIEQIPIIDAEILAGHSLHEALCRVGGYPDDFLDTLAVGEQSGRVVESMGHLARQYQDQARAAIAILTVVAGWIVWAVIAGLIIALIFRVFSFYLGAINEAARG